MRLKRACHSEPATFDARLDAAANIRATGQIRSARLIQALVWHPAYLVDWLRLLLRQRMLTTAATPTTPGW